MSRRPRLSTSISGTILSLTPSTDTKANYDQKHFTALSKLTTRHVDLYASGMEQDLHAWRKSLEEEFRLAENAETEEDFDALALRARKKLIQGVPEAVNAIIELSKHAQSESIKLNASKYIIDTVLSKRNADGDDPVNDLIKSLAKK